MRRDVPGSILALVLVIGGAGCGAGSAFVPPMEDHSPPPKHREPELARRPYTAETIRAASPVGRWMRYRIVEGDAPPRAKIAEYRFTAVDAAGATIAETETPEGAAAGAPEPHRRTWDELDADASFPDASTTIHDATVTTAAGRFDCQEYVVRQRAGGADSETTLDFATAMPGPPVRMRVVIGGATQLTMELMAFGGVGAAP